MAALLRGFRL